MQEILIATISVSVSEGHTSCPGPVALKNVEQKYVHYEASVWALWTWLITNKLERPSIKNITVCIGQKSTW